MPEVVVFITVGIPDIELQLFPPAVMESPIVERCMHAKYLVARPAIQLLQLGANVLKAPNGMSRCQFVELPRDAGNVESHGIDTSSEKLPHRRHPLLRRRRVRRLAQGNRF